MWIRSTSRSILVFIVLAFGLGLLLSVRQLDSYLFSSDNKGKISPHVRKQKVDSFIGPCLCNLFHTDTSNEPTTFKTEKFPEFYCCQPTIGNGFVATVVYSDRIHMNGLYNGRYGDSHRARIPSLAAISFQLPSNLSIQSQSFTLDVEQGVFIRFAQTKEFNVTQRIYAHEYFSRLLINDISIVRNPGAKKEDIILTLSNNEGSPSEDINFKKANSTRPGVGYMFGNTLVSETEKSGVLATHVYWTLIPPNVTLPASETSHMWTFTTSISNTSSDSGSFFDRGQKSLAAGDLFDKHRDLWLYKWSSGRVDLDQDLKLAKAIYGSMYYILSSLPPLRSTSKPEDDFTFFGLSPASLASGDTGGSSYKGHVFWDQETWMYPSILIFHPELALRMLESRTIHMDAAAAMAKKNGYDGLKFPWEMAYSGYEVCPAQPYSSNELHINGDIAFAIQQYVQLTNDLNFLNHQGGMQMIEGLAKFWASKAVYDPKTDTYSIKDVMGPDEYHQNVTNSVYTNSIAKISLSLPSLAARKLGIDASSSKWQDIADKLVIPFDKKRNYHPEFDGYSLGTRIKQADAILLGYPLLTNISSTTRQNDLELYDTIDGYHVTDVNGPAMTWSMYVIGWLEIGNVSKAEKSLQQSLLNLQEPFKVWTEEATGFGAVNFITGMGGFLQSIVYGYTGFRIKADSLHFAFTLPSSSKQFNITGISYLGNEVDFRVTESTLLINRTSSSPAGSNLEVKVDDKTYQLKIGQPVMTKNLPGEIRKAKSSSPGKQRHEQKKSESRPKNNLSKVRRGPMLKFAKDKSEPVRKS